MKKIVLCILILIENCHCELKTKRKNSKIAKKKILKLQSFQSKKKRKFILNFQKKSEVRCGKRLYLNLKCR